MSSSVPNIGRDPKSNPKLISAHRPVDQTQVLANYALQVGVKGGDLGQGAAIALYLLPVLLILSALSLRNIASREGL